MYDDVEVKFPDQKPFINQDNRTLVPVRFVSNALGAKVEMTYIITVPVPKGYDGELPNLRP